MTTAGFVLSSYNRARYLVGCIESVLSQTRQPDRIVVVDDGSGDGSQDIVRGFSDQGVELFETDRLGPSGALNAGVGSIGTDVVAVLAGDDQALPDRLARQLASLESSDVELVMGLPLVMDEQGEPRSDDLCPEFFVQARVGTGHLLRQLFQVGNFLCAPTATFLRETFLELGGFQPGLLQLQDFDLWVRWAGGRRVAVSDERVIRYRKESNSLSSQGHDRRMHAERVWVYRHFFDDVTDSVVETAFREELQRLGREGHFDRTLDITLLYLGHPDPLVYQIGCERLLDICNGKDGAARLAEFGMRIQDVYDIVGRGDLTRLVDRESLLQGMLRLRANLHA
ncbi:MAG: glycosyltransferase family A protein [Acidimicrobiia bacterium]